MDRDSAKEEYKLKRESVLWINYDTLWFSPAQPDTMIGASANTPDNQQRRDGRHRPHITPPITATKTKWLPRDSQTGEKRRWVPPKGSRENMTRKSVLIPEVFLDPRVRSDGQHYPPVDSNYRAHHEAMSYFDGNQHDSRVPKHHRSHPHQHHGEKRRNDYLINAQDGLTNTNYRNMLYEQSQTAFKNTDPDLFRRMEGHSAHESADGRKYLTAGEVKTFVKNYEDCEIVPASDHRHSEKRDSRSKLDSNTLSPTLGVEPESRAHRNRHRNIQTPDSAQEHTMNMHAYSEHAKWKTHDKLFHQTTGTTQRFDDTVVPKQPDQGRKRDSSASGRAHIERNLLVAPNSVSNENARAMNPPKSPSWVWGASPSSDVSDPVIAMAQKMNIQNPSNVKRTRSRTRDTDNQYSENIRSTPGKNYQEKLRDHSTREPTHIQDAVTSSPQTQQFADQINSEIGYPQHFNSKRKQHQEEGLLEREGKTFRDHLDSPTKTDYQPEHLNRYNPSNSGNYSRTYVKTNPECLEESSPEDRKLAAITNVIKVNNELVNLIGRDQSNEHKPIPEAVSSIRDHSNYLSNELRENQEHANQDAELDSRPGTSSCLDPSGVRISVSTPRNRISASSVQNQSTEVNQGREQGGVTNILADNDTSVCDIGDTPHNVCYTDPVQCERNHITDTSVVQRYSSEETNSSSSHSDREDGRQVQRLNSTENDAEIARCLHESQALEPEATDGDNTDSSQPQVQPEDIPEVEPTRPCAIRGLTERELKALTSSKLQKILITAKCEICWDPYKIGDGIRHLICAHYFHVTCIDTWLKRTATCPVCRTVLVDLFLPDIVSSQRRNRRHRRCVIL